MVKKMTSKEKEEIRRNARSELYKIRTGETSWDEWLWYKLLSHYGHKVSIQIYWDGETPMSVTLEDENTNEIVLDAELYTLKARDDAE